MDLAQSKMTNGCKSVVAWVGFDSAMNEYLLGVYFLISSRLLLLTAKYSNTYCLSAIRFSH